MQQERRSTKSAATTTTTATTTTSATSTVIIESENLLILHCCYFYCHWPLIQLSHCKGGCEASIKYYSNNPYIIPVSISFSHFLFHLILHYWGPYNPYINLYNPYRNLYNTYIIGVILGTIRLRRRELLRASKRTVKRRPRSGPTRLETAQGLGFRV